MVVLAAEPDWIDPSEDAWDDIFSAHPVDTCIDIISCRTSDKIEVFGSRDEHLRRYASGVQESPHEVLFADCFPLVRHIDLLECFSRTCSDYSDVVIPIF